MGDKKSHKKRDRDDRGESIDERYKRKAAKKAEKVAALLGYTNEVNPFGDSNLLQPFVWGKRREKDLKETDKDTKRLELMEEIARVRKRREDREAEVEEMERLRGEEQRLREAALYGDWQKKEEDFHIQQTVVRSKIRVSERREKLIDLLAKNILLVESAARKTSDTDPLELDPAKIDVELRDPVLLIEAVDRSEISQLLGDIEAYIVHSHNSNDSYKNFWSALKTVAESRRDDIQASDSSVHSSLIHDVKKLVSGKTDHELSCLEADVEGKLLAASKLASNTCSLLPETGLLASWTNETGTREVSDSSYWDCVLREIKLRRAKLVVAETHRILLEKQLGLLASLRNDAKAYSGATDSPAVVDLEDQLYQNEKSQGMDDTEEKMELGDEIALPGETYWWQDKYRPRKPRFFNRVRTGWDWNKYNQTHYDHDNPPPKTIQGYKFAIFYPDLIDKLTTPKYYLEAAEEKEFAILRFSAGPPYEDIAFKIVNRQWDIHRRSGFRCVFERGVLQLNFNFKRQWYRR